MKARFSLLVTSMTHQNFLCDECKLKDNTEITADVALSNQGWNVAFVCLPCLPNTLKKYDDKKARRAVLNALPDYLQ